jgi:CcmD family protein
MTYLFAAYAVFWGLSFLFLLSMSSKQRQLERQLRELKNALERDRQSPKAGV